MDDKTRNAHKNAIGDAKVEYLTGKAVFDAKVRLEWAVEQARLTQRLHNAVWAARDAGVSIKDISEGYGTKNRGTIYDILNSRPAPAPTNANPTLTENNAPEAAEKAIQVEHVEGTVYRITLPDDTWFTTFAESGLDRTRHSQAIKQIGTAGIHQAELLDNTHPVWATLAAATNTN